MCGRIVRTSPADVLAAEFDAQPAPGIALHPRYNLCPGEDLVVVVRKGEERRLGTVRWGFVPSFAKAADEAPRSINARAETVAVRPPFRDAFRRRRCLVAVDGFYEWRREGRRRQPYLVRLLSHRPMGLAGLWERWRPREGQPLLTGLVITCPATGRLAAIHDRMPVILAPEAAARWLDPTSDDPHVLRGLLVSAPDEELEIQPASLLVNSPRNDSPECLTPEPAA
jgi:putative SOS response-associated peptidase YedK